MIKRIFLSLGLISLASFCPVGCGNDGPADGNCGNQIKDPGEECDGDDFGEESCRTREFYTGSLGCTGDCKISTSNCNGECGDGVINGPEQCDGEQLGGRRCVDLDYDGGELGCTDTCRFDTSGCTGGPVCGDNEIEGIEECDPPGTIESQSCGSRGIQSRTCTENCYWGEWGSCVEDDECTSGVTQNQDCGNCGTQTRTCEANNQWGAWSSCTGEGVCSPGSTQNQDCGDGGYQTRTCDVICQWGAWGSCMGEGDCSAGETQDRDCGNCGTQMRTCQTDNQWGAWGSCTGEGVCSQGSTQDQGCGNCGTQTRTCDASCQWGTWGACIGDSDCVCTSDSQCISGNCSEDWDHATNRYCAPQNTCANNDSSYAIGYVLCNGNNWHKSCASQGNWSDQTNNPFPDYSLCDAGGGSGSGWREPATCTDGVGFNTPACNTCEPYMPTSSMNGCRSGCSSDNDAWCWSGYHCFSGDNRCYNDSNGSPCDVDSECNSGRCIENQYHDDANTCQAKLSNGEECWDIEHSDCISGNCAPYVYCDWDYAECAPSGTCAGFGSYYSPGYGMSDPGCDVYPWVPLQICEYKDGFYQWTALPNPQEFASGCRAVSGISQSGANPGAVCVVGSNAHWENPGCTACEDGHKSLPNDDLGYCVGSFSYDECCYRSCSGDAQCWSGWSCSGGDCYEN